MTSKLEYYWSQPKRIEKLKCTFLNFISYNVDTRVIKYRGELLSPYIPFGKSWLIDFIATIPSNVEGMIKPGDMTVGRLSKIISNIPDAEYRIKISRIGMSGVDHQSSVIMASSYEPMDWNRVDD
jgi:hypothetical protein